MIKKDQFLSKHHALQIIHYYLFLFIIYSFLGWIVETSFIYLVQHHFRIRGLLAYGLPLAPQYGLFSIIILKVLSPLKKKPLLVLGEAFCIASILEYLYGLIERNIFHLKTWDYSNIPYSYEGIISLPISICWSLLSLLTIYFINQYVEKLFSYIPPFLLTVITWTLMIYIFICFVLIGRHLSLYY